MRKFLAVMLSLILLVTMAVPAFAVEDTADAAVGFLTLYASNDSSSSSGVGTTGHAFFAFKNVSSNVVRIGVYYVDPGETITFGTWGNGPNHQGVFYNLESYVHYNNGGFSNRVSTTVAITASDAATITQYILNNDSYHLTQNNCVDFAIEIWADASGIVLSAGLISQPVYLMSSIRDWCDYVNNEAIPYNMNVGYALNGTFHEFTEAEFNSASTLDCNEEDVTQ